jgi:two-component system, sensor histidine kinase and response regulator
MVDMTHTVKNIDDMFGAGNAQPAGAAASRELKGKKILVVDDNPINLDIAVEALMSSGANVDSAPGGAEAIKLLADAKYDLVLLDLTMPGVDGMTVGRTIRASSNNQQTPVLLFTASDTGDALRAVKELRAQGLVSKPVDVDDLLKSVAKHT